MLAFFDRASVYVFGALLTFFLAKVMDKPDFGRYALYQSIIEFCCVLGTLGVGPLLSDAVAKSRLIPTYKQILLLALLGGVLGAVAFFLLSHIFLKIEFSTEHAVALVALFSIFVFSLNQLEFSWNRYFDGARLLNRDAAIRSLFVLTVSGFIFIKESSISFMSIVFLNLCSYLLATALNFAFRKKLSFEKLVGAPVFDRRIYSAWIHAVSAFVLKKADIFVVGYYFSFSEIAVFKIAFLLMEVPAQFLQAFLNGQLRQFSVDNEFLLFRRYFFKVLIWVPMAVVLIGVGYACFSKYALVVAPMYFLSLGFYFFIKSLCFLAESYLLSRGGFAEARNFVFLAAVAKYSILFFYINHYGYYLGAYPIAGGVELLIVICFFKRFHSRRMGG